MRYFTLEEAEQLLPAIEQHLRDALFHKAEYEQAHQELERLVNRIRMSGGARVNPGTHLELRARRDSHVKTLKTALEAIEETGAMVKDLDIGLLDFMSRYQEQDVCLCWKLGEDGITWWHGETEGFRGRKPIDDDFRANHRGDGNAPGPDAAETEPQ